ncbi:DNA gyrase subunit A [Caldisericum exile]|uniref:DNA topoisomerase (ATP-hydrolyzing) n=1 Tax=Caldisericum exile (strain DSM 21853 / NBRC 104410 / AZM16c01) TaxID=511051 RepID=A0A7U6JFS5_CALEA|nr:DNA gyrase subunit A [Caldisericum exile]BAL80764.1 DNA gyrase subunit A [Caldisericum exile AZM16c01]
MSDLFHEKVINVPIEEEVKKSYLDYSMSVIIGRALPDVRDGLKPVHRRILFAMNDLGCLPNKPYKKSARIVGEVLGKYHPHGESSVYDALVRMAQPFSLRYPLVDGHGNFGSIDGDVPAAMRYTEARLAPIAMEMLEGLDENTVDFVPNFDNTLKEPVVLPAKIPNLLVNGSSGIAVGMATNIPPHNLKEVVDALVYLIDTEILKGTEVTTEELRHFIKGPDFPTGATILDSNGIKEYFETGKGSITIRGKYKIEEGKHKRKYFVITEIPYEVNKAELVEEIANLAKEKKIKGVEDIRDESDREGIRIVIKLSEDVKPEIFEAELVKFTRYEIKYGVILLGIIDNQPKIFTLKELLNEFLRFRGEVLRRQTQFKLEKAKKSLEILSGIRKAILSIDVIIPLIKESKDNEEARNKLMAYLEISEEQARAILDMRLARLTSLEVEKIDRDIKETEELIKNLNEILTNKERFYNEIKEDLRRIGNKFGDARKTEIQRYYKSIDEEELIPDENIIVIVTRGGYLKRMREDVFKVQRRGGKGVIGQSVSQEDYPIEIIPTTLKSTMLFFTNIGKVYSLRAFEIPELERTGKGTPIHRLLKLLPNENISKVISIEKDNKIKSLLFVTRKGLVKKTKMEEFVYITSAGKIALKLKDDDELETVIPILEESDVMMISNAGLAVRFDTNSVREMGRASSGVIGMKVKNGEFVVDAEILKEEDKVILVTEKGYGKILSVKEIRKTKRGAKGVKCIKLSEKTGNLVAVKVIHDEENLYLLLKSGNVIKIELKDVKELGRNTRGVILVRFKEGEDTVSAIALE